MSGRPRRDTEGVRDGILQSLRMGNTRTAASETMGISRETLRRWTTEDVAFCAAVKEAEAYAEQQAVKTIVSQFPRQWTAAAWWLERRRPREWGKVDRLDITIQEEAQKLAEQYGLDAEKLIAEAERIAAGSGDADSR